MKKIFWVFFLTIVLLFFSFSQISAGNCPDSGDPQATGLVPCGVSCSCTLSNFFVMLARIFNFVVKMIATPLAIAMLTIGGVMILISAGNQNLLSLGKKTVYASIIGLVLVFCSWLIIDFILKALGYDQGDWWRL